jgi:hypothetical protein
MRERVRRILVGAGVAVGLLGAAGYVVYGGRGRAGELLADHARGSLS